MPRPHRILPSIGRSALAATAFLALLAAAPAAAKPPGAQTIDAEEGLRLFVEGRLEVQDPRAGAEARARRRADRRVVRGLLESHPELSAALRPLLRRSRNAARPRLLEIGQERGVPRTVVLDGDDAVIAELADSITAAGDPANAVEIYRRLHQRARRAAVFAEGELPTPEAAARLGVGKIKLLIKGIVAAEEEIRSRLTLPANPSDHYPFIGPHSGPADCIGGFPADAGDSYGGDQVEKGKICDLSWKGIVANDSRPYRNHLSCIRNQGGRGTCGAFAIASALEAGYSRARGLHINLSEQMLYFRHKAKTPKDFDGMRLPDAAKQFVDFQTILPLELAWSYNPSFDRTYAGPGLLKWSGSCNDYDETCSESTPQGKPVCFRLTRNTPEVCGLAAPPNVGGVRLTAAPLSLWDPLDTSTSIAMMKMLLDEGMQLTLAHMVNGAFLSADTNDGYVFYDGENQSKSGAHAVHIVAYIDNEDLVKIVPGAPLSENGPLAPKSAKPGYFIARNSWSSCWGDGGYVYIPYRWLRPANFVYSVLAFDPGAIADAP